MDKEALKQAWDAHGKLLGRAYRNTLVDGSPPSLDTLNAAAELNRFLDHGHALARIDGDIALRLAARDAQGEYRLQGHDRVALQSQQQRLTDEYMWFMEYRRESELQPVFPGKVDDGLRRSELSADGHDVVTGWNPDSALGRGLLLLEDAKSALPAFGEALAQARTALTPGYQTCVTVNQAAASFLGGTTAVVRGRTDLAGRMAADAWGEGVGAAYRTPAQEWCRLAYPDQQLGRVSEADAALDSGTALAEAGQPRQALGDLPQSHAGAGEHHAVDVPVALLASYAVADALAAQVARQQLSPDDALPLLRSSTDPRAGIEAVWPELLAQAGHATLAPEAATQLLPGRAFVQATALLAPEQKNNFQCLMEVFAEPLAGLSDEDRLVAEEVMAFHYVDELAVHGGLDRPLDMQALQAMRALQTTLPHEVEAPMPEGAHEPLAVSGAELPEGLKGQQAQVSQVMSGLMGSAAAQPWSLQERDRLEAFALSTAVQHRLGPSLEGAWLSKDGQRIGLLDRTGVLREFAVADALSQDAQTSLEQAAQRWGEHEQQVRKMAQAAQGKSRRMGDAGETGESTAVGESASVDGGALAVAGGNGVASAGAGGGGGGGGGSLRGLSDLESSGTTPASA